MRRLSISTWSLDEVLGKPRHEAVNADPRRIRERFTSTPQVDLLDVPRGLRERGIGTMEICHFHLPSTDGVYLERLRHAARDAAVELFSVLIDTGDLTHPDPAKRAADATLIAGWIDVAAELGVERVRIDGGHAEPTPEAIDLAVAGLAPLRDHAASRGLVAITENWHATTKPPEALLEILRRCPGLGLCLDFGNAEGPRKRETLEMLAPHAGSIHAKARRHADGSNDADEMRSCLAVCDAHRFAGPISLIASGWQDIEALRDVVRPFVDAG